MSEGDGSEQKTLLGAGRRAINVLMRDVHSDKYSEDDGLIMVDEGGDRTSKLLVVSEGMEEEEEIGEGRTCQAQMRFFILFYFILFYFILFCLILFCFILFTLLY